MRSSITSHRKTGTSQETKKKQWREKRNTHSVLEKEERDMACFQMSLLAGIFSPDALVML